MSTPLCTTAAVRKTLTHRLAALLRHGWIAAICSLFATPALAAPPLQWTASWGAPPAPPLTFAPNLPDGALSRAFRNQTIVQIVRLSAGGSALRIRLTNEYGTRPLRIGAAYVALVDADGRATKGTQRPLTFDGSAGVAIPAGAPWISDTVALTLPPRARLQVSLYLPEDSGLCTCHPIGGQTAMISPPGDYTTRAFVPIATFSARAFIAGVDVLARAHPRVIVTFGDSITDGYLSTVDTDRRWPDRLAERLERERRTAGTGMVNAGLSGNRMLLDGSLALFGESGLARFDRDVLSVPGVTTLIVLLGINDIGQKRDTLVTAAALIEGYRQIVARAHGRGIRVLAGTIMPYEGYGYYRPEGDVVRRRVNEWILTSGAFDGTIDFDRVMRDPRRPSRLRADLHSGDWLHPNDKGYQVMGDAVNLSLVQ